jgi:hypothetical protein
MKRTVKDFLQLAGIFMAVEQYIAFKQNKIERINAEIAASKETTLSNQALSAQENSLLTNIKSAAWSHQGRLESLINTKKTLIAQKNGCEDFLSNPNISAEEVILAKQKVEYFKSEISKIDLSIMSDKNETLDKILNMFPWDKNNFIDNYHEILEKWREFLLSLDDNQLCSLISLSIGFIILFNFINIIVILNGNFIIIYFKLEERFPKLANLIKLRQKVTNISLVYSYTIIFILLILLILINASNIII